MHEFIEVKFISEIKGKGAFAKKDIEKETVIDIANVVLIPNKDYRKIKKTQLYNYCYIWEDPKHKPAFKNAITLSVSQFINHSYVPICSIYMIIRIKQLNTRLFKTLRKVKN